LGVLGFFGGVLSAKMVFFEGFYIGNVGKMREIGFFEGFCIGIGINE
jgi:hypothetical protein